MKNIKYTVVAQCHIVKKRCSGYFCEYAIDKRVGLKIVYGTRISKLAEKRRKEGIYLKKR